MSVFFSNFSLDSKIIYHLFHSPLALCACPEFLNSICKQTKSEANNAQAQSGICLDEDLLQPTESSNAKFNKTVKRTRTTVQPKKPTATNVPKITHTHTHTENLIFILAHLCFLVISDRHTHTYTHTQDDRLSVLILVLLFIIILGWLCIVRWCGRMFKFIFLLIWTVVLSILSFFVISHTASSISIFHSLFLISLHFILLTCFPYKFISQVQLRLNTWNRNPHPAPTPIRLHSTFYLSFKKNAFSWLTCSNFVSYTNTKTSWTKLKLTF